MALVRIRHVAVDCMFMSHTVLNGISRQYNIDTLSLLRFFTTCGQKYAKKVNDPHMAQICYNKAAEFISSVTIEDGSEDYEKPIVARALFDLFIGKAECAWENSDTQSAEQYIKEAKIHLEELPGEHEFLASVEYNFGLYTYQARDLEGALRWLKQSIGTRGSDANPSCDESKQARTMRLTGVCLLALQRYAESWDMMKTAEDLCHDPTGAYLLLKLSIIAKKPDALDRLLHTINNEGVDLEICMTSIALFADAQRVSDAVLGYSELSERFKSNKRALVCTIGPRHFETMMTLGRVVDALAILEQCCSMIPQLCREDADFVASKEGEVTKTESGQFARWATLAFAAGCECADRNDFMSAAVLLNRALQIGRTSSTCAMRNEQENDTEKGQKQSNVVMEHEASICRFASSCALCAIDDLSRGPETIQTLTRDDDKGANSGEIQEKRDRMLRLAVEHGNRAKELEKTDFTPRMLLFRAYLVDKQFERAASELLDASRDIKAFDAGAIAEAACAARDVASTKAVISALRCAIELDSNVLLQSVSTGSESLPRGFYGAILVACVDVMRRGLRGDEVGEGENEEDTENNSENVEVGTDDDLILVMRAGLRGLRALGVGYAFDKESDAPNNCEELQYLTDVAWNEGRSAGMQAAYKRWKEWFDLCYGFCSLLPESEESVRRRLMCKLMSACAIVEDDSSMIAQFEEARKHIVQAQSESQRLIQLGFKDNDDDPVKGLLLFLEARIMVGCEDFPGLDSVVSEALTAKIGGGVLEQLAAVCHSWKVGRQSKSEGNGATVRAQCTDLAVALLEKAIDSRLSEEQLDVAAIAMTIRERVGLELSRGMTSGRPLAAFRKAVDFAIERGQGFPNEELRWLAAIGCDRVQILLQIGRCADARSWATETQRLVSGYPQLSSYRPRLVTVLSLNRAD